MGTLSGARRGSLPPLRTGRTSTGSPVLTASFIPPEFLLPTPSHYPLYINKKIKKIERVIEGERVEVGGRDSEGMKLVVSGRSISPLPS